jgi:GNAT superfamily N-acetyltransferase
MQHEPGLLEGEDEEFAPPADGLQRAADERLGTGVEGLERGELQRGDPSQWRAREQIVEPLGKRLHFGKLGHPTTVVGDLTEPATIQRIRDFSHSIEDASATRTVPFNWGTALFNDDFPRSWAHNFLRVDRPTRKLRAAQLVGESERLQRAAGNAHRQVMVEDETTGARLREGFVKRGWHSHRHVVMALASEPDRAPDLAVAEELGFDEVRPLLAALYRSAPYGDSEETVRQLVERNLLTAAATDVRHFGVRAGDGVVSSCDLYSDGRTAQIEDVNTLEDHRNRGFARAAVSLAVREARRSGCDLIWLEADADDWPRLLYTRLGFEPVGHSFMFTRPPRAANTQSSG